ncbi:TetR/AcrR family transcriptional regulator [Leptolyngbya iicbica]|uniref:TetR family transcriptional regulator n=2 Tax=Cyanophyceae TaxID=3028117 RepID=A0A4Q7E471_9CYAN|nr:TetR/AcrR family transcriptional regulator [Leptolyngbya sp. LK]RZM76494.1 TetR family transcriptional regulator [Leptolyngbya sp. LK]
MANLKRTREDILEAVIDTVHRQGLTATGLSELFRLSGASSGSFYNYFESKQALGHALIDFEWEKLEKNVLEPAVTRHESPIDQVFWILDTLEAKQTREPFCGGCLLGNLIVDLVEQDDSFREHLQTVFARWEGAIAQRLHAGRDQLLPATDPDLLAAQIMTVIEGAMLMGKLHRDTQRLHASFDVARQLLTLALKPA